VELTNRIVLSQKYNKAGDAVSLGDSTTCIRDIQCFIAHGTTPSLLVATRDTLEIIADILVYSHRLLAICTWTIASTSIGTPKGSVLWPIALRADLPASPKTSIISSVYLEQCKLLAVLFRSCYSLLGNNPFHLSRSIRRILSY
jgi:hypothetical protein